MLIMCHGQNADPFNTAGGGDKDKDDVKDDQKDDQDTTKGTENITGDRDTDMSGTDHDQGDRIAGNAAPTSVTGKRGPGTHPTETGAQEQAATTAPEGTQKAEEQRQGEAVNTDKQIDESANKRPRTD